MTLIRRKSRPFLNRYTTLPVLLDMLVHKKIVLLNPKTWEDRNDAYFLKRYQSEKKHGTVVAICFSKKRETFHHWKIFSGGTAGVCIEFDKELLLEPISKMAGFLHREVDYKFINDVKDIRPDIDNWPFVKREPFRDEDEYRIVFESATEELTVKDVQISLDCITKVTLSPWMPESVAETVKEVIKSIKDCQQLKVNCSTLLETPTWKAAIDKIDI